MAPILLSMCNLYSQTRNVDAIRRLFRVADNRARVDPQPAIFPAWTAPVIRKAADGERELVPMSWAWCLSQPMAGLGAASRTYATTMKSSFWKPSFEARRCLVPASSYCEPDTGKPVKCHWFAVNGEHDRELFAFPGQRYIEADASAQRRVVDLV